MPSSVKFGRNSINASFLLVAEMLAGINLQIVPSMAILSGLANVLGFANCISNNEVSFNGNDLFSSFNKILIKGLPETISLSKILTPSKVTSNNGFRLSIFTYNGI